MRLGGRAYKPVGIPQHLEGAPGVPSTPHGDPLPPLTPMMHASYVW